MTRAGSATQRVVAGRYALSVGRADMPTPNGWQWAKLTDIARLESGHTPSRQHPEYWDGDIQWIGIPDAREHHAKTILNTRQTVTQAGIDNSAARLLPANTVCLSRTASVGYVTVMGRPMSTSQDFVNWVCSEAVEAHFLKYLLVAEGDHLRTFGEGSTHTTIYFPEVQSFHVCIPPVGEQRRIVAKLDDVLARSRRAKQALDAVPPLLEKLRQSILAAAFRGDLTADWRAKHPDVEPADALLARIRVERRKKWEEAELAKMNAKGKPPSDDRWKAKYKEPEPVDASGLPELPAGWAWSSLDDLTFLTGGITKGQKRNASAVLRAVPYLRVANVQRGRLDLEEMKEIDATAEEINDLRLEVGDILLNEGGDRDKLGRGWVWSGEIAECIHQNHVFRARPVTKELQAKYISHYANTLGQTFFLDAGAQTTNLASVSISKVRGCPVALPPADEQLDIVRTLTDHLARLDAQAALVRQGVDRTGSLERAVLAKAFRGQLLPHHPTDDPRDIGRARPRSSELVDAPAAEGRGPSPPTQP